MEKTLILIKPEIIEKKLFGKIISIYEENNLTIENIKMLIPEISILENHYYEHKEKFFYNQLLEYMSRGKIIAMISYGKNAVEKVRQINGATNPQKAKDGTIRKLYGTNITENAVHSSATIEDAIREIEIWFR